MEPSIDTALNEAVVEVFAFKDLSKLLVLNVPDDNSAMEAIRQIYQIATQEKPGYWSDQISSQPVPTLFPPPMLVPGHRLDSTEPMPFLWLGAQCDSHTCAAADLMLQVGWHFAGMKRTVAKKVGNSANAQLSLAETGAFVAGSKTIGTALGLMFGTLGTFVSGLMNEQTLRLAGGEVNKWVQKAFGERIRLGAWTYTVPQATLQKMTRHAISSYADAEEPRIEWAKTALGMTTRALVGLAQYIPPVIVIDHAELMDETTAHVLGEILTGFGPGHPRALAVCLCHKGKTNAHLDRVIQDAEGRTSQLDYSEIGSTWAWPDDPRLEIPLAVAGQIGHSIPEPWFDACVKAVMGSTPDDDYWKDKLMKSGVLFRMKGLMCFRTLDLWQTAREMEEILTDQQWVAVQDTLESFMLSEQELAKVSPWVVYSMLYGLVASGDQVPDLWFASYLNLARELGTIVSFEQAREELDRLRQGKLSELLVSFWARLLGNLDDATAPARALDEAASTMDDEPEDKKADALINAGLAWADLAKQYKSRSGEVEDGRSFSEVGNEAYHTALDRFEKAREFGSVEAWRHEAWVRADNGNPAGALECADEYKEQRGEAADTKESLTLEERAAWIWAVRVKGRKDALNRLGGTASMGGSDGIVARQMASPEFEPGARQTVWVQEEYAECLGMEEGKWDAAREQFAQLRGFLEDTGGVENAHHNWHLFLDERADFYDRMVEEAPRLSLPRMLWYPLSKETLSLSLSNDAFAQDGSYVQAREAIMDECLEVRLGPWRWDVLNANSHSALLRSHDLVARAPIHDRLEPVSWADCWLRGQLTHELASLVGDDAVAYVRGYDPEEWPLDEGEDPRPKDDEFLRGETVFLQTPGMLHRYDGDSWNDCHAEYDTASNRVAGSWWLSQPLSNMTFACVDFPGLVSWYVDLYGGVRPAVTISLSDS